MSCKNHPIFTTVILVAALLISSLSGCKKPEATERETIRVFSQLLPENDLFYSEDGGIWGYSNRVHGNEGEPEQRAAVRYGPVFLPETEDVGDTLRLHITGIRKTEPLGSSKQQAWWFLDYSIEQSDSKNKAAILSLQIRLDGKWYLLPSGGLTPESIPELPNSISLMKGRLYPEETEQIIPGHYRLVLIQDWRGNISLDVEEFDLLEKQDGYVIDHIQKPAELFKEKNVVPGKNVQRKDGSKWTMVEASPLEWWESALRTDTLEAETLG